MHKLIVSSLAVLLAVSVYAEDVKEEENVVVSEEVTSDDVGSNSLYQNADCSNCEKTKK